MNTFNLEGAIVQRAHTNLRSRIVKAMEPMRALVDTLTDMKRHQEFRQGFDRFEHQLFNELRPVAEKEAMEIFIATYEEVAAIVNAANAKKNI